MNKWNISLVVWLCLAGTPASADVKLAHVFGNDMVLQRKMPLPVWGWADAGEKITVRLGKNMATVVTGKDGKWMTKLQPMPAGGPHQMKVSGKNTIHLKNIMVGEVWICSGQSNMAWSVRGIESAKEAVASADKPNIRYLCVPPRVSGLAVSDIGDTVWRICNPETVKQFSAVAYYFGLELHRELNVPIGLVETSFGGTAIEPWTPLIGLASETELQDIVKEVKQARDEYRKALSGSLDSIETWVKDSRKALASDQPLPPTPFPRHRFSMRWHPTTLYNGMVRPLAPYAIRGAIWYQGESNIGDGMMYHKKMKALINGWRKAWGQGEFPFYFVQLSPFRYSKQYSKHDPYMLAKIRQAQLASLSIPKTGMAVTMDIGDLNDIHPQNKLDVGKRLALWALAKDYGRKKLVYSGPLYKSMSVKGNKAVVMFDHVGSGLVSRDGKPLTWFEIAGADRKFVKADAKINGDRVVVSCETVPLPVAVRFGWHEEALPNLMNKEGLPASPFHTDPDKL